MVGSHIKFLRYIVIVYTKAVVDVIYFTTLNKNSFHLVVKSISF